jgi:catechol 2,3-dioxygenase-like lactoylglutathione lyase family enzyme
MDHLALVVSDQERAQRFYETYCGFGVGLDDPEAVRAMTRRLEGVGQESVEQSDEPDYASVKCRDPDGHIVEFSWETA